NLCGQCDASFTAAGSSFQIFRETTNVIKANISNGSGFTTLTGTTQFTSSVNTAWHHCALILGGGLVRLNLDGIQEASSSFSGSVPDSAGSFFVGNLLATGTPWQGWIDEFRLSIGVARW